MPILAGWLTGEQVPHEVIEQTIQAMKAVLERHGRGGTHIIQPGFGLVAFSDPTNTTADQQEPSILDWSPERRTLTYRRPLSGLHPLYYIEDWPAQGNLLFASEIKALFALGMPRRWHLPALDVLMRHGFIPAPWTAFKGVEVVPAGSHLRWQHAKTLVQPGTDFTFMAGTTPPTHDHLLHLLQQASENMQAEQQQVVALSGGSPAAMLATVLAAESTRQELLLATISTTKTRRTKGWRTIEQLALSLDLPQLAIAGNADPSFWLATLTGTETPCSDTRALALHQLLHATATEAEARIAISGLGGELLAGKRTGQQLLSTAHTKQAENALWSPEAYAVIQREKSWEETLHARKLARQAEHFTDPRQRQYYLDLHTYLPDKLVAPYQQLAQQEQIELRSPYLHIPAMQALVHAVASHIAASEQNVLADLLQHYGQPDAEEAAQLPLAIPQPALPAQSHTQSSAPSDLVEQVLSPDVLTKTGIFSQQAVQELRQSSSASTPAPGLLAIFTTQLLAELFQVEGW